MKTEEDLSSSLNRWIGSLFYHDRYPYSVQISAIIGSLMPRSHTSQPLFAFSATHARGSRYRETVIPTRSNPIRFLVATMIRGCLARAKRREREREKMKREGWNVNRARWPASRATPSSGNALSVYFLLKLLYEAVVLSIERTITIIGLR